MSDSVPLCYSTKKIISIKKYNIEVSWDICRCTRLHFLKTVFSLYYQISWVCTISKILRRKWFAVMWNCFNDKINAKYTFLAYMQIILSTWDVIAHRTQMDKTNIVWTFKFYRWRWLLAKWLKYQRNYLCQTLCRFWTLHKFSVFQII